MVSITFQPTTEDTILVEGGEVAGDEYSSLLMSRYVTLS